MENPNNRRSNGSARHGDVNDNPAWFDSERPSADETSRLPFFALHNENPAVRAQVRRLLSDYQPPLYARLRGADHERSLRAVETVAATFIEPLGYNLDDTEMQAFAQHFLSGLNTHTAWRWVLTGLAGIMTYRGRKTFRFPLFQPAPGGKLDPFASGAATRHLWHMARFGAYYSVLILGVSPVLEVTTNARALAAMKMDPRLAELMREREEKIAQMRNTRHNQRARPFPQQQAPGPPDAQASYGVGDSISAQAQPAWASSRQAQPSQEATASTRSRDWDSLPDDLDDASPVAPSLRPSPGEDSGASAWDRIRRQSLPVQPERGSQGPQQSWQAPQGVGAGDDDAARDSYSFSSADEDKAVAKSQAQKEFDEMLARERLGEDNEQGSWERRKRLEAVLDPLA